MGFYDTEEGVKQYIEMAEGYDGAELVEVLHKKLPQGSTVLELGMGPGKDLDLLRRPYRATGSDSSAAFLDLYRRKNSQADLLLLDARTMETERKFDCIYSNKVLHHLTKDELKTSLQKQRDLLSVDGLLMHSFWYGTKEEEHEGLRFIHYTEQELKDLTADGYELLELERYEEMVQDDSIYMLLRNSQAGLT